MKYTVGIATEDDIKRILPYTTENAKVDWGVVRKTTEMRAFFYKDEPIMILGLIELPTGNYEVTAALWGLFRTDVHKHTRQLVRVCQDLIFSRPGYTFLVYVDTSEQKFIRFAEFFGFKPTKELAELGGKVYRCYKKEN